MQTFKHSIKTLAVILLELLFLPSLSSAAEIRTVERSQAEEMKRAQVEYNGRTCPLNTPALDFVRKLTGKTSFRSLTAEQVLLSWSLYPEDWKDVDMIRVKDADVRHQLGIEGNMTWALVTFLVYMFPLLQAILPWFANSRHMKAYLRLAFLSVLMTYFGCNYLFTGLHSYAN